MTRSDLAWLSVGDASRLLRRRDVSPVEVTQAVLDRIEHTNPLLNAFITVMADRALEDARRAEEEIGAGQWRGPLHGIPVSVKDMFHVRGERTTAASKFLASSISDHDAAVVERLRDAGAVLVGKTNLHEFAYGTTSGTSHFGAVRNPWDPHRIPGGSSGGAGAAVAAGMSHASIGTDTGGSIRIPAALCGVVGLKPTFGRVSRFGLIPLAASLDHVGPLTRTVEDAGFVLQMISGHDPRDPCSAREPVPDFSVGIEARVRGLRIGLLQGRFDEAAHDVAQAVGEAVRVLEGAGAEVCPVVLPVLDEARALVVTVLAVEATSVHLERLTERPEDFGTDVRERLERGRSIPAVDYVRALEFRRRTLPEVRRVFEGFDALVSPMIPVGAPRIGSRSVDVKGREVELVRAMTGNTREWNLFGLPALTVPCGLNGEGLPVGMQLVGDRFAESRLLRIGRAFESLTDWYMRRPSA